MQEESRMSEGRLLPELPAGEFIDRPEVIDRFVIQILPEGVLTFMGTRERIAEFLQICAEEGLELRVEYVTLCG
jgi:hypothetical protein